MDAGATRSDAGADAASKPAGVTLTISPKGVAIAPSGSETFTCTVTGSTNTACTWQVTETGGGSVTSAGVYKAPATVGTYHVVATSAADTTKSDTATVVVTAPATPGVWINVTPAGIDLNSSDDNGDNFGFNDVLADPMHPSDVYAYVCYQGVWKSSDFGVTFTKVSAGASMDIGKLWSGAIAPDGSYLLAGVGNGTAPGLYKSTTAGGLGTTWTQIFGTTQSAAVGTGGAVAAYSVDIDPGNPQHFVMAFHENDGYAGLVETLDGGSTWIKHDPPTNFGGSQYVFLINSNVWIVEGQSNGGTNGTWQTTTGGLVNGVPSTSAWKMVSTAEHVHGAAQLYNAGNGVLYIGSYKSPDGVLRSADNGATWNVVFPTNESAIVGTPKQLYTGMGFAGPFSPYLASGTLDGMTWTTTGPFSTTPSAMTWGPKRMAVVFDGTHSIIVAGMWDAGIWRYVEP